VVDDHLVLGVLEDERDVGHSHGGALDRAGEDRVVDFFAANGPDALAAEDPLDRFDDVALSRSVGADDDRDPGVEDDFSSGPGKS